jgi:hypothetical protein
MFEHPINPFSTSNLAEERGREKNAHVYRYNTALNKFKAAILKGKIFRLFTRAVHRKPFLYDLNELRHDLALHGSCYSGIRVVHIGSIIGSEGKVADFDMRFHPISEAVRERWVNMAIAYLSCLPLPPVQLIQIGNAYFVRDGHHRISVARALGQVAIDAEFVTWKTSSPLPWQAQTVQKKRVSLKRTQLST